MGKIYNPEDDLPKIGRRPPDLEPGSVPEGLTPTRFHELVMEVRALRLDVEKIKRSLEAHGIPTR